MNIFITIVAGVSVFVLGQIVLKWLIEPIQEFRRLKGEVLFHLASEHEVIHNAKAIDEDAAHQVGAVLHDLGARLHATLSLIPMYPYSRKLFLLPKAEQIRLAAERLRLISNSMYSEAEDIHYKLDLYRMEICDALQVDDPIQGGMSRAELIDGIRELRDVQRNRE